MGRHSTKFQVINQASQQSASQSIGSPPHCSQRMKAEMQPCVGKVQAGWTLSVYLGSLAQHKPSSRLEVPKRHSRWKRLNRHRRLMPCQWRQPCG